MSWEQQGRHVRALAGKSRGAPLSKHCELIVLQGRDAAGGSVMYLYIRIVKRPGGLEGDHACQHP